MPQAPTSNNPVGVEEEPFVLIEQEGKFEDWFFKLFLPAVIVLFIIGSVILLS